MAMGYSSSWNGSLGVTQPLNQLEDELITPSNQLLLLQVIDRVRHDVDAPIDRVAYGSPRKPPWRSPSGALVPPVTTNPFSWWISRR